MTMQVEVKPGGQVMQEVFLSPRVLDRHAFDAFSGKLSELIERAATQTAELAAAAVKAEQAQAKLREQAQTLETRIAATTTSMQLVAAQSEEAKRSMGEIEDAGLRLRTIELATSRGIEDAQKRLATIEQAVGNRLGEALADATARVSELESRLNQAEAKVRQLSTEGPVQLMRALCERAERLLATGDTRNPGLSDFVKRGEKLVLWAKHSLTDLDQLRAQSEAARRALGEAIISTADAVDMIDARKPS